MKLSVHQHVEQYLDWNLWNSQLKKRDASAQTPSFSEFCNTLAVDIVANRRGLGNCGIRDGFPA